MKSSTANDSCEGLDVPNTPTILSRRQTVLRTIFNRALPGTALCFLMVGCAGFLPPWSVCLTLFISALTASAFYALKRNPTAIAVGIVSVIVSGLLLWPHMYIRGANSTDKTYPRYFGASHENFSARNIAVATGALTLCRSLTGELFHIQDGRIQELNGLAVGRSPNQVGAPYWVDMRITLALVQYETEQGTVTQLGAAGQSRGGGGNYEIPTSVRPLHSQFIAGRLFPEQSRILYVEGDSEFRFSREMTVQDFAQANSGSFYVVVVGMR